MASTSTSFDMAGSRHVVREYKPEWLNNVNPDRAVKLEQRMVTREEDRTAPYPFRKRNIKMSESSLSCRFPLMGSKHAVVEPYNGKVYIKIREYIQRKDKDVWTATHRGINLKVEDWKALVTAMPVINHAVNDMEVS